MTKMPASTPPQPAGRTQNSILERINLIVGIAAGLFAVLGITIVGMVSYFSDTISKLDHSIIAINEQTMALASDLNSIEERLSDINSEVDRQILDKINTNVFIDQFSEDSILSQFQAQAVCSAMTTGSTSVRAVFRRATSRDKDVPFSTSCVDVCRSVSGPLRDGMLNVPTEVIGGVHIYQQLPPFNPVSTEAIQSGLGTFIYRQRDSNIRFGPNYCCCAG